MKEEYFVLKLLIYKLIFFVFNWDIFFLIDLLFLIKVFLVIFSFKFLLLSWVFSRILFIWLIKFIWVNCFVERLILMFKW